MHFKSPFIALSVLSESYLPLADLFVIHLSSPSMLLTTESCQIVVAGLCIGLLASALVCNSYI